MSNVNRLGLRNIQKVNSLEMSNFDEFKENNYIK
jgi:hypothetical protein